MSDEAFKLLATGEWKGGLERLQRDAAWNDANESLDGPFLLAFPEKQGWGEGLLLASQLKRVAVDGGTPIRVVCNGQIRSILKDDKLFALNSIEELKARSPLTVLRHALLGKLLELPFHPLTTAFASARGGRRPRVGFAFASMDKGKPIQDKSVPASLFGELLGTCDAERISFQRRCSEQDQKELREHLGDSLSFLSDEQLDAADQSEIVREISALDCMITISTTTAHIAAAMGVPVILLAARRNGPQWFWRAQAEHGKVFYPSVDIHFGERAGPDWFLGSVDRVARALCKKTAEI